MPDGHDPYDSHTGDERFRFVTLNAFRSGMRGILRLTAALIGFGLIVLAIPIGFVTPLLPIGLPIAIVGVVLLGRNSLWGRKWMEGILRRFPSVERFAPNWLMVVVFGRDKRI